MCLYFNHFVCLFFYIVVFDTGCIHHTIDEDIKQIEMFNQSSSNMVGNRSLLQSSVSIPYYTHELSILGSIVENDVLMDFSHDSTTADCRISGAIPNGMTQTCASFRHCMPKVYSPIEKVQYSTVCIPLAKEVNCISNTQSVSFLYRMYAANHLCVYLILTIPLIYYDY